MIYDEIIDKRKMKIQLKEEKIKTLDAELFEMYQELEYFENKREELK